MDNKVDIVAALARLEKARETGNERAISQAIEQAITVIRTHPQTSGEIVGALSGFGRAVYSILHRELCRNATGNAYLARLEQLGRLSGFFGELENFLTMTDKRLFNHLLEVLSSLQCEKAESLLVNVVQDTKRPASVRAKALTALGKRDILPVLDCVFDFLNADESSLNHAALTYLVDLAQFKPDDVFKRLPPLGDKNIRYLLEQVKLPPFPGNLRLLLPMLTSDKGRGGRIQHMIEEVIGKLTAPLKGNQAANDRNRLLAADLVGRYLKFAKHAPIKVFLIRMVLKLGDVGTTVLKDHLNQAKGEVKKELSDIFMKFPAGKSLDLLDMVLDSLDTRQGLKIIQYLKLQGSIRSIEMLVRLLSHTQTSIQTSARDALTTMMTLSQIIAFLGDRDPSVRVIMLQLLKLHAHKKETRELAHSLLNDKVPIVRKTALETMAFLGKERDPAPFLNAACDPDDGVKAAACTILKSIKTVYGQNILIDHMSHPDPKIAAIAARVMAARAWKDFESRSLLQCESSAKIFARAVELDPQVRRRLVYSITNPDHKIRFTCAKILAGISDKTSMIQLLRPLVLKTLADPHPHIRATGVRALQNLGHVKDSARLIRLLNDSDDRVRANVVETLGKLWSAQAGEAIRKLVGDASPRVQANVAVVLAKRGTKEGARLLHKLLNSNDPQIRLSGQYALQAVGDRR